MTALFAHSFLLIQSLSRHVLGRFGAGNQDYLAPLLILTFKSPLASGWEGVRGGAWDCVRIHRGFFCFFGQCCLSNPPPWSSERGLCVYLFNDTAKVGCTTVPAERGWGGQRWVILKRYTNGWDKEAWEQAGLRLSACPLQCPFCLGYNALGSWSNAHLCVVGLGSLFSQVAVVESSSSSSPLAKRDFPVQNLLLIHSWQGFVSAALAKHFSSLSKRRVC